MSAFLPPELRGLYVLSIRQPWAWLILNAGKDVENRSRLTRIRGRILIHASKGMTRHEFGDGMDTWQAVRRKSGEQPADLPAFDDMPRGGIVGSVEIADCVAHASSPWFFGEFGYVLRDPKPLPFVPMTGQRGFFRVAA